MRVLQDPATGELVEIFDDEAVQDEGKAYSYTEFRRAALSMSKEHRGAVNESDEAGKALAAAEADYHRKLAVAVVRAKQEHGATVAETLAKGDEEVALAKDKRDAEAARDRAAMERVRLCRDDRAILLTMGAWSRASEQWES